MDCHQAHAAEQAAFLGLTTVGVLNGIFWVLQSGALWRDRLIGVDQKQLADLPNRTLTHSGPANALSIELQVQQPWKRDTLRSVVLNLQ